VSRHDDLDVARSHGANNILDHLGCRREHGGIARKGTRERKAPLFATRHRSGRTVAKFGKSYKRQQLGDPRVIHFAR
jgi:hypothetical protein